MPAVGWRKRAGSAITKTRAPRRTDATRAREPSDPRENNISSACLDPAPLETRPRRGAPPSHPASFYSLPPPERSRVILRRSNERLRLARGGSSAATARAIAHDRRADPVEDFRRSRARSRVRGWRDDAVPRPPRRTFFPSPRLGRVARPCGTGFKVKPPIRARGFRSRTADAEQTARPSGRGVRRFPPRLDAPRDRATDDFARSDPALPLRPPPSLVLVII